MSDDVEAKFLDSIRRNPEDDEVRRVYADWLESRGDLRGEYLRLELLMRRAPGRLAELESAIDRGWIAAIQCRYAAAMVNGGANKISAIKLVRELSGLGLRDAKDLVDAATRDRPAVIVSNLPRFEADNIARRITETGAEAMVFPIVQAPPPRTFVVELVSVAADKKLAAIKAVRAWLPIAMGDAKELVESVAAGTPARIGIFDEARAHELVTELGDAGELRLS